MRKSKSVSRWEVLGISLVRFLWFSAIELYYGIMHDKIDIARYLYTGTAIAAFFVLRLDSVLAQWLDRPELQMSFELRKVVVYSSLFSGWMIWSGQRAFLRARMLSRLRDAFNHCGLESNGRLPAFIEDRAVDDHVRKLKLRNNGLPLQRYVEKQDDLDHQLNIQIVKMTDDDGDKSRINILYAMKRLDSPARLDSLTDFQDGEIPIGVSYEGPISVNMRDVAHILTTGHTGGGKSNFEKVAATVLTVNNPEARIIFLDFKGGMDVADLTNKLGENYSNFQKYEGPIACTRFLAEIGGKMEDRLKEISRLKASNLDDYLKKRIVENPEAPSSDQAVTNKEDYPRRTYLIIDEIAQLYARDPSVTKDDLLKARAAVNRIARQGRAAGVHLIVATQKPDAISFDQTVKANLPAVLCFPMNTQASSISALGTKRAYDLNPEIKGRAVWKYGPKVQEVQAYLFE